ncbi:MAG: ABC transporter permease [Kiritimatiellia bacterium]
MRRIRTIAFTVWIEVIRAKEVYVLLILLAAMLLAVVSLNVFGLGGAARYAADTGLLAAWVFAWILTVNVASRQLPREEQRGTVYSLLAKPVSRFQVVASKWLGAWTISCACTLAFYILVAAVVWLKGMLMDPAALVQAYVLHCMALGTVAAIGIAFSAGMHSDAAASITYVLSGAAFLILPRIPHYLVNATEWRAAGLMLLYNLLPHFEVFDMRKRVIHDYGTADWMMFLMVIAYGVILIALFILIAWAVYRNRRFSRGNI